MQGNRGKSPIQGIQDPYCREVLIIVSLSQGLRTMKEVSYRRLLVIEEVRIPTRPIS